MCPEVTFTCHGLALRSEVKLVCNPGLNSEGKERLEKKVLKCVRSYIPLNFVPEVYSKPGCMLELPGKFNTNFPGSVPDPICPR